MEVRRLLPAGPRAVGVERHRLVGAGDETRCGSGVAVRPDAAEAGRSEQQDRGDRELEPSLPHRPPVITRDEGAERFAAGRSVVDEVARAPDSLLEPERDRVAGPARAREREVGGGRAIQLAEPADIRRLLLQLGVAKCLRLAWAVLTRS